MIMKLLLIIGVIAIVYFMFFKKTAIKPKNTTTKPSQNEDANELVKCAECGVYVELDEAILAGGAYFCSNECVHKKG